MENMNSQNEQMVKVPASVKTLAEMLADIMKKNQKGSLLDIFNEYVVQTKELFKTKKDFHPMCFFIFRDYDKSIWKAGAYPLFNFVPGMMDQHSVILKKLIKEMKVSEYNDFKLVGVLKCMDSHVSVYDRKEIIGVDGKIMKDKFIRPRDNPDSKDVLQFELEEPFVKHTKSYEYIRSDNDIVFRPEPFLDAKSLYDEITAINSNMSFLFTEGQRLN